VEVNRTRAACTEAQINLALIQSKYDKLLAESQMKANASNESSAHLSNDLETTKTSLVQARADLHEALQVSINLRRQL
jgi:hypothetical protein